MRLGLTHMGNLYVGIKGIASKVGCELVITPPTTQRTLSLGVKFSPETVCLPFKLQLGNMIEALEMGADTLVMPGGPGPCRFGYYNKLHKMILHELGYKFHLVTQERSIMHIIRELTGSASLPHVIEGFRFGIAKLKAVENLERLTHKMRAVEQNKGEASRVFRECVKAIDETEDHQAFRQTSKEYEQKLMSLPIADSPAPLKIGITGEVFIVLDPFANMDIEIELGKLGVEVKRTLYISDWVRLNPFVYALGLREKDRSHRAALPYLSRHVGGDGWQSVGEKVLHARDWDGLIHLEPFGCVPEIMARNIMPYTREPLPVLDIIFDEHTGRAGVINRLEAFVDMIRRKKRKGKVQVCA